MKVEELLIGCPRCRRWPMAIAAVDRPSIYSGKRHIRFVCTCGLELAQQIVSRFRPSEEEVRHRSLEGSRRTYERDTASSTQHNSDRNNIYQSSSRLLGDAPSVGMMGTVKRPRDIAERTRQLRDLRRVDPDGFLRETFTLSVDEARAKARAFLGEYPSGGYMTIVEKWRQLPDGQIEFTMRRLPAAD